MVLLRFIIINMLDENVVINILRYPVLSKLGDGLQNDVSIRSWLEDYSMCSLILSWLRRLIPEIIYGAISMIRVPLGSRFGIRDRFLCKMNMVPNDMFREHSLIIIPHSECEWRTLIVS